MALKFLLFVFLDFKGSVCAFEPEAIRDDITGFMEFSPYGLENVLKTTEDSDEIGKRLFFSEKDPIFLSICEATDKTFY